MLRVVLLAALVSAGAAGANPNPAPSAAAAPTIVQRVPVGPYDYVLYSNGNIYVDNGLARKLLDDGTGTAMIAGEHNNLFVLKSTSQIWWYDGKAWSLIDEGQGTVKITLDRGCVVAHKENGDVWRCTMKKGPAGEWIPDWGRAVLAPAAPTQTQGEVVSRSGRE